MLQGKFAGAVIGDREVKPPLIGSGASVACKCAKGYHVVVENNLYGGEPGCHCESDIEETSNTKSPKPLRKYAGYEWVYNSVTNQWYLQPDYNYNGDGQNGTPVIYTGTNGTGITTSVNGVLDTAKNLFSAHPVIIGAAVLGLGYMFFSGGLAASDRTITSVTRFSPRKRNGIKRRNTKRR